MRSTLDYRADSESQSPPRGWLLWAGLVRAWRQFRRDWSDLPRAAWKRYFLVLFVGAVLCAALTAGLTFLARAQVERDDSRLQAWDERTLRRIEAGPISFQNAVLLESFGNLAYLIPLTALCLYAAVRAGRPLLAVTFPLNYILMRPIFAVGWWLWDRQRPDLIAGGIARPPLHSYPSGHVALSLAAYGLLAYLWMRHTRSWTERTLALLLFLALVGVVGWARLRLGTHWPSDVIAGWVIGFAWLVVVIVALRRAESIKGK